MPNRTEARPAKAVLPYATGRLPPLRLFSTPLTDPNRCFERNGLFSTVMRNWSLWKMRRSKRSNVQTIECRDG
jgi:hypothetical protein